MKNLNFLKASSLLIVALVLATCLFTSTNTTDKSNEQVIVELSERLANMEAASSNEVVGVNPLIGEISLFAGNFAPRGYALCHGQPMSISSNSALFSVLGTYYGGDGRTTFHLPDLRGRAPIGAGQGPGLKNVELGQKGGVDEGKLNVNKTKVSQDGNNITEVISHIEGNRPPYTSLNYIICVDGIYPSRN